MKRFLTLIFISAFGIGLIKAQVIDTLKADTLKFIPNQKPIITVGEPASELKQEGHSASNQMNLSSTDEVGKSQISVDVSATGAGTFSMPIVVPHGIGGFMPEIGLVYSSQNGNGIAGYGWSLAGYSSIVRIPKTKAIDGEIGSVNFDENDRFALDGQRLILKSGAYGGNDSEYVTENYSNLRIFCRAQGQNPYSGAETSFEVWFPDGSKAFYGTSTNSRTLLEYAISYRENPIGARINYSYNNANNILYLSQINYGGKANQTMFNKIDFIYGTAQRAEQAYVGGISMYRDKLLSKISVSVNDTYIRHYTLSYTDLCEIDYQRLSSLTEWNGQETKSLIPIYFNYAGEGGNIYMPPQTITNFGVTGITNENAEAIFADFTGNGSTDMIIYPKVKDKFWVILDPEGPQPFIPYTINGYFKEVFTATTLTHNNKILAGQNILVVRDQGTSYKFEIRSTGLSSPLAYQYDRVWDNLPMASPYFSEVTYQYHDGAKIEQQFLSGDFNGDGLTDVVAIGDSQVITYEWVDWTSPYSGTGYTYGDIGSNAYLINLDRRITTNNIINLGALAQSYSNGDKLYTADFNGDGKTDILHVKNGRMMVYTVTSNNTIELLWQPTIDTRITNNYQLLLGDYNGDGKYDIIFATQNNASGPRPSVPDNNKLFATFMSTGKGFVKTEDYYPFSSQWGRNAVVNNAVEYDRYHLIATDINGDGKTDIIRTHVYQRAGNTYGTFDFVVYSNMGVTQLGRLDFDRQITGGNTFTIRYDAIPVIFPNHLVNTNLELGFLSGNALNTYSFPHNERNSLLSSVWQNYVSYSLEYEKLMSNSYSGIYTSNSSQSYPNIDIENVPTFAVVSRIERRFTSQQILQQTFRYENAITNTEGLGFLGFGKTTRSNWHVDEFDENRMFNITLTDPQLRGAPIKTFTTKEAYLDPSIASSTAPPPNITLSTPITTAQTTEASNSITLTDGFEANGANGTYIAQIANPATGIADGASSYDYITRTDYTYHTQLLPNKVFINTPTSVATKDLLNGTNTLQLNEYDSYYNITKTTTNLSGAGIKTEEITYDNNTSGYYIGRPLTRKTTATAAGDTHSSEEEYTYTGHLPTQIKKKGHGTPWITEDLVYDAFGNITQKSISTASGTRTTGVTYDASGRFPISQTDVEGLTSTATFDAATGNLLSSTTPYGQTTTYIYDTWGRLIETTDYLGKKAYQSFESDGYGGAIITKNDDEGSESTAYVNALGQITQSTEKTLTGSVVGTATEYDVYGRAYRQSQPAAPDSYDQWNETEFDEYGRVKKTTAYTGKVTNISYNVLSTTVNDGTKSITTTKNALGKTTSVQDPGGTINYTYYAHGGLKTADYGGSTQTLEYDGWGRKTKLTDPSAGQYTYAYNGFGEVTQETTPKGVTNYTYDNAMGKLTGKNLTGDDTGLAYTYSYDNTTKLLNSLSFTNADGNNATYTYIYDNDKRLISTVEDNLHARFTKTYTYDGFGRIATESYEAKDKASNTTANRTVAYTYQNGELLQAVDQTTGKILSKVNTLKSNGQLATELHGNSLKTTYNYDSFNLPQNIIISTTDNNPTSLLNLGYSFDAQRGNLTGRTNHVDSYEYFTYDNQDRLTGISGNAGNSTQNYDARGRITYNSQLGNYGYSDAASYQQTELTNPTPTATAWYQDRALQQMSFNALKKPVNINEQGKEQIDFLYNAALQRSTMYYGSDDADKDLRPMRRHYSEDGGMEITRNIVTGETSFVFYLSGDAYDAPAIYKEVHNSNGTTQDLYYLHRDYLGSIVLITDADGNAVEKRQFDAWGNIVALTDGNGNPLAAFVITDRGYTGHEHLLNVGLINMNGRLYDPMLHRFVSPDNHVQDPFNTQNFNRYGYVMNNPLIASDPNGEFLHLIIGAIVGGIINWAVNGAEFSWKGLAHFGVGALAGGLGAGIGTGISAALAGNSFAGGFMLGSSFLGTSLGATSSFFNGALIGAASGFSGGFASGFGNSLIKGESFGSSLMSGLKTGGMGGISGGLVGGIVGGIDAVRDERRFFDGAKVDDVQLAKTSGILPNGQRSEYDCVPASMETIDKSYGGSMNQQQIRGLNGVVRDPTGATDALLDGSVVKAYAKDNGYIWGGDNGPMKIGRIVEKMNQGGRVALSLNTGERVGHMVVMRDVIQRTITKIGGKEITKFLFNAMDPWAGGGFRRIDTSLIKTVWWIIK